MNVTWTEITRENLGNLESVLELYDEVFQIDVREPHDIFFNSLKYRESSCPNRFRFLVGMVEDRVASFVTGHYMADVNAGFIVYLATNPLVRSRGLGSETLSQFEKLLNEDALAAGNGPLAAVILETEMEEFVETQAEREDCEKRQRFYAKNHYKRFDEIDYLQPPLHGAGEGIPLKLLIKDFQGNKLATDEVRRIVQAIYREKYCNVNEIDKAVLHRCLVEMGIE